MKVFEGEEYPALLRESQKLFTEVKGLKPEASRDASREMFIVAKGFRPPPASPAQATMVSGESIGSAGATAPSAKPPVPGQPSGAGQKSSGQGSAK
jgi:hypothetical protein